MSIFYRETAEGGGRHQKLVEEFRYNIEEAVSPLTLTSIDFYSPPMKPFL